MEAVAGRQARREEFALTQSSELTATRRVAASHNPSVHVIEQGRPSAATRLAPRLALAHERIAWSAFLDVALKGKPAVSLSEVLADAEQAVTLAPDNRSIRNTRGQIYPALGRIEAAFADLDKAIVKGIAAAGTYYGRGRCHEARGNKDAAIADYRKALSLQATDDYQKHVHAQARQRLAALGAAPESQSNPK